MAPAPKVILNQTRTRNFQEIERPLRATHGRESKHSRFHSPIVAHRREVVHFREHSHLMKTVALLLSLSLHQSPSYKPEAPRSPVATSDYPA
jgi:hypothetical protein